MSGFGLKLHAVQWEADQRKAAKDQEWLHFEVAQDGVDVLIMLGTDSMIEKAVRHGHQGPLYMDATHGLNDKGLKVVTVHVKDLEGRGANSGLHALSCSDIQAFMLFAEMTISSLRTDCLDSDAPALALQCFDVS